MKPFVTDGSDDDNTTWYDGYDNKWKEEGGREGGRTLARSQVLPKGAKFGEIKA